MSKHLAEPNFKTRTTEFVEERMKDLTGRREPIRGNGAHRASNTGQAAA